MTLDPTHSFTHTQPYDTGFCSGSAAQALPASDCRVTELTIADIPLALHFINAVRDGLPEDKKHFLKPKEGYHLLVHAAVAKSPLLGVHDDANNLVAFGMVGGSPAPLLPQGHAIIQSVCSTARGVGRTIVSAGEDWARAQGYPAISAKVSQINLDSLRMFETCGFESIYEGYDAKGGYPFYILSKQLG